MFSKLFTIAGLVMVANAHMKMSSPVPYGRSDLQNGPLLADGSDFPCKQRSNVYNVEGASNIYAQGSTQQLAFIGQAVHGGGSCQVSVTTDLKPNKNSVWKVIKSIEGGCPAKGQAGNMGDNANAEDPFKYDFTVPKELSAGNYTIAWTWFNKVGNREMYMNCGPLTVTGSAGSQGFLNTLPDMFVANVDNGCEVPSGMDLLFPAPGKDVDRFNGATSAFAGPSSTASPGCPTNVATNQPTYAQPTGSQVTRAPASSAAPSIPGGVFITAPPNNPAPTQPAQTPQPSTTSAPVASAPVSSAPVASSSAASQAPAPSSAPAPAPGSGSDSGSSGAFAAGTACSPEGQWNCVGGTKFQRCASGTWSSTMSLANGLKCTAGQSSDLRMASNKVKRSMRRVQRIRA